MKRKRQNSGPKTREQDEARREALEQIVTCSCSHGLQEHSPEGCTIEVCDCKNAAGMLLLGKIAAIDDL